MFSKNYCRKKFKFYCVFSIPFYKTGKVFILTSHVNIACKDMQVKMCSEEKQLLGGWRHCSCVRRVHSSSRVWHSCGWFLGILGPLQGKRWLPWALVPEVQSCYGGHTAGDSCSCWALPLLLPKSPGAGAQGLQGPQGPASYHRYTNCRHCGKASSHTMLPLFLVLSCLGQLITAGQGKWRCCWAGDHLSTGHPPCGLHTLCSWKFRTRLVKVPRAQPSSQGLGVHLCLMVGGLWLSPKTTDPHLLTFHNQKNIRRAGGEEGGYGEGGSKIDRGPHMSHVFSRLEKSLAKAGYSQLCWGVLPVSLSADSETPLLQTTVPQKIENSINNTKVADTHIIKKPDFREMSVFICIPLVAHISEFLYSLFQILVIPDLVS